LFLYLDYREGKEIEVFYLLASSSEIKSFVYGRGKDKEKIVSLLLKAIVKSYNAGVEVFFNERGLKDFLVALSETREYESVSFSLCELTPSCVEELVTVVSENSLSAYKAGIYFYLKKTDKWPFHGKISTTSKREGKWR